MENMDFFRKVLEIKELKRSGWEYLKVDNPESVSDHSFVLALMAMVYGRGKGMDVDRMVRMALVHDLCEIYSGDITLRFREGDQEMSNTEKRRREARGMEKLLSILPEETANEIQHLWKEHHSLKTEEARFLKQLDRLEMAMQAAFYRKKGRLKTPLDMLRTADRDIKDPGLRKILKAVVSEAEEGED